MNSHKPPLKKSCIEASSSLPLPNDLLFNCLARVSKLHYPTVSLVSKSFQSLLTSPGLYQTRLLQDRTEICLYVCLRFPPDPNPRWFMLCRKPNGTLKKLNKKRKKNKSSGNVLAPIQVVHSPSLEWLSLISVGPYIYAIRDLVPLPSVKLLDCWSHTWREAPGMRIKPSSQHTSLEGAIYLAGVHEHPEFLKLVEVFDTKTQTWKPTLNQKRIFETKKCQGKIYSKIKPKKAFDVYDKTCEAVGMDTEEDGVRDSYCIINNVSYRYISTVGFLWHDNNSQVWRNLEGLKRLPKFASHSVVKLVNYGGKLVVFWTKYVLSSGNTNKMIWCAEISLRRHQSGQIFGKVEWLDGVLTVPSTYEFMNVVAANL